MTSPGGEALAAVAELRRLVLNQRFEEAERLLTSLHGLGSATTIDMLRQLCVSGAEQLRIASELDSAARAQRLLAQEVQRGIEALLASWERHIKTARQQDAAWPARPPSAVTTPHADAAGGFSAPVTRAVVRSRNGARSSARVPCQNRMLSRPGPR